MTTPLHLISVIIPIYRVERYLRQCVDSVLLQTYTNLEIMLVDDGSPDGSYAIMQEYAARDARIKIFQKPNGGLSDARNYALERYTGDFVYFVDSDDFIDPTTIEKLYHAMVEADADIAMCSYCRFDNNGHTDMPRPDIAAAMARLAQRPLTPPELYDMFFQLGTTVWRAMFRASLLRQYSEPFPTGIYYEDDYWHSFYRLRARRIVGVNEELYHYRTHGGSITGQHRYPSHILEIYRRFERANADYLRDPVLLANYNMYKPGAIRWHLFPMLDEAGFPGCLPLIAEIKRHFQGVDITKSWGERHLINLFRNNQPVAIYFKLGLWRIKEWISKLGQRAFKIRISRKDHIGYIQLLGIKIDFSDWLRPRGQSS